MTIRPPLHRGCCQPTVIELLWILIGKGRLGLCGEPVCNMINHSTKVNSMQDIIMRGTIIECFWNG